MFRKRNAEQKTNKTRKLFNANIFWESYTHVQNERGT